MTREEIERRWDLIAEALFRELEFYLWKSEYEELFWEISEKFDLAENWYEREMKKIGIDVIQPEFRD